MELVTSRLVLREYASGDLDAVHRFASDPVVTELVAWGPNTLEDTRSFLDRCAGEQRESPRRSFTLAVSVGGGEPCGSVGLYCDQDFLQAETGFVLAQDRWGAGYATEAAAAVLAFGLETLGLRRVWATCRPGNAASARVLERIGMQREGLIRDHVLIRGRREDSLLYAATSPTRGE